MAVEVRSAKVHEALYRKQFPFIDGGDANLCRNLKQQVTELDETIAKLYTSKTVSMGTISMDIDNRIEALEKIRREFELRRINLDCDKLIEVDELKLSSERFDAAKQSLDEMLKDKKKQQNLWLVIGGIVILLGLTQIIRK
jgi:L-fucose isomerase-like protein